jgi:hypothetical protein
MIDKIKQAIEQSELVQLATIEAIHRLYYDNVGNDKETGELGDYLACIWNMHPDWRHKLHKELQRTQDRYKGDNRQIKDVPLCNRPKQIIPLEFPVTLSISRNAYEPVKFERRQQIVDTGRYTGEDKSEFIDNFHIDEL